MNSPWQHHPLFRETETALAAVRLAGGLCRAVQQDIDPGSLAKKDRSPVTVADFGSQALICRAIHEVFPGDPIIGEEDAGVLRDPAQAAMLDQVTAHVARLLPDAEPRQVCDWIDLGGAKEYSPRFWTLDPIDGTKGFLRKEQYAIALALIIEGEVVAGILGCPNLGPALGADRGDGSLFLALKEAGVWQMPLATAGEAVPVAVSDRTDPTLIRFCESVEAAHSSHGDAARIAAELAIAAESARLDSQAKYGVVARGEAEAYLRLPRDENYREKIWDHAAGMLVVTEAGGRVTDIQGRDLDFSRGYLLDTNRGVVAANPTIHAVLLKTIRDLAIGVGAKGRPLPKDRPTP